VRTLLLGLLLLGSLGFAKPTPKKPMNAKHPLLAPWAGPHSGVPPFDQVSVGDFEAALEWGMADQLREIDAIANNKQPPTFANTLEALEKAGQSLSRVSTLFYVHVSNLSTPEVRKVEATMAPKLAAFSDRIVQNEKLFARIKAVYDARATGLTAEQQRVAHVTYTSFVKQGAALDAAKKKELSALNQTLATKFTTFSQNQLHDEEERALVIEDEGALAGLSAQQKADAAAEATRRKAKGWAFANTRSVMEPLLTVCSNRDTREKAWRLWSSRGDFGDAFDNKVLAAEILKLRAQKAGVLGFPSYADWKLSDSMAKTPAAAMQLMRSVWAPAKAQLEADIASCQKLVDQEKGGFAIAPWDYRFYAEKVRRAKYDLDVAQLTPYLQLEHIREAMFYMAKQLYGFTFAPVVADAKGKTQFPVFHPDVSVYDVTRDGKHVGYWYFDPYARPGKQSGAWMNAYRDQHRLAGDVPTIVSNNSNFVKAAGQTVTLSWDDARTMFHEFGHALHGLSSNVTYPSLSGTNTARDFVEFPSQFHEHYLSTKPVLAMLVNEKGETIPPALLERLEKAKSFNAGFATAEAQFSAIVDMSLHMTAAPPPDLAAYEKSMRDELKVPSALIMRHRIPHFGHVFSGEGYSAGYYSYLWAEVLESDAYAAFVEAKDPYHPATAKRLFDTILSVGNTVDPAAAFEAFRGRAPSPDALLRDKGFVR
jgi:peptidyl-dipeptidase Dcp